MSAGTPTVLYEEDNKFGRAVLEEGPDGCHYLTVSGPSPASPAVSILLDREELLSYRTWGVRFVEVLARRVRANPGLYASRNLLPPSPPPAADDGPAGRGGEPSPRRVAVAAACAAFLLLLLLLAWLLDPPGPGAAVLDGTARELVSVDGDGTGERRLRVELPGGESVLVHVPDGFPLREGAPVSIRERRSRIFGKRSHLFVRYR